MPGETLERIRLRCSEVARKAVHVRVCSDALDDYARRISSTAGAGLLYDQTLHFRGSPEDTVAYLVTLDAVNFGSGYFPHLAKRPGTSGYGTIAGALTDRFRARGPISADELLRITTAECGQIFRQDPVSSPIGELMSLFAHAWNDLGRDLLLRFRGSFTTLVDAAGESAERMVGLLDCQPFFRDVSLYGGRDVPFYKRAQILASDLALAFNGTGWGRFHDLGSLTLFADNLVPHVLRLDGVLTYSPDLAQHIEREELLPPGCPAEVEIRACALHAVEGIVESLRATGRPMTARDVDGTLWNRGQAPRYKASPRHRTRTTAY